MLLREKKFSSLYYNHNQKTYKIWTIKSTLNQDTHNAETSPQGSVPNSLFATVMSSGVIKMINFSGQALKSLSGIDLKKRELDNERWVVDIDRQDKIEDLIGKQARKRTK